MSARVRWKRSDIVSAKVAAVKLAQADGRTRYVMATALGYAITADPRDLMGQAFYACSADGMVVLSPGRVPQGAS